VAYTHIAFVAVHISLCHSIVQLSEGLSSWLVAAQGLSKEVLGLAEAPDPELWADDDRAPAPHPPPAGLALPADLATNTASSMLLSVVADPASAAAGSCSILRLSLCSSLQCILRV
jgi:hypothetical protein